MTTPASSSSEFAKGLVFGFDVGTGSIGYAVRQEDKFLDVGVVICPEETNDLSTRRGLRRQRRTLRSRKCRREWFAAELAKLGLSKPAGRLDDPVTLRLRAVRGEEVGPEELHAALSHLFKRRGYSKVPWANVERATKEGKAKKEDEEGPILKAVGEVRDEMKRRGCQFPCELLAARRKEAGKTPVKEWGRKIYWPRELLEDEFRAIATAQAKRFPRLQEKADWLLYGEAHERAKGGQTYHVFFNADEGRNPGVLGLRWPRFDNRGPGLDLIEPRDEFGRPRYVMGRTRPEYRRWQAEVALLGFTVVDLSDKKKQRRVVPGAAALAELREIIARTGRLTAEDLEVWIKPYREKGIYDLVKEQPGVVGEGKGRGRFSRIGIRKATEVIRPLQAERDAMSRLTPKGQRARKKLKTTEDKAEAFVRQHMNYTAKLRYNWRNPATEAVEPEPLPRALRRFIQEIRDPVVRHRVELIDRELDRLLEQHCPGGEPSHVVVECVRELAQDADEAQAAYERRQENRAQNQTARETLRAMGISEPTDKDVRKFRLLQECKWRCPYTLERFMQAEFDGLVIHRLVPSEGDDRHAGYLKGARAALEQAEVEHMVPQASLVCDEWFNVTVTRRATNDAKGKRIPYEFVLGGADEDKRAQLLKNAEDCFGKDSLKYRVFTSADARALIPERDKLQRTAYIARCLRYVCLLKFGWLSPEDRDPGHEQANDASRGYLVTNGGITRRLRGAWNLDELLRDTITPERWAKMDDGEKERALSQGARIPPEEWKKLDKAKQEEMLRARRTKNRQDVRHHALDAMVAACTLPWAASTTVWSGGWCNLSPEDGSVSSVRCPVFGENDYGKDMKAAAAAKLAELKAAQPEATRNAIRHYRSRGRHKQIFDSQLYGKRTAYGGKPLERTAFVVSKKLSDLTPGALNESSRGDMIFSPKLREQIKSAWEGYTADIANWKRVLERTRAELQAKRAEAVKGNTKRKTLEAIDKRLWRVAQWLEKTPGLELWAELQEFLHREKGAQAAKPVFPDDFIAGLRHWRYGTEIRSVQVIGQTKDEEAYVELRQGSKTFWKYKARYQEMRVYEKPAQRKGGGSRYLCWLVRPFYPRKAAGNGESESQEVVRSVAMPAGCRGLKLVTTFTNGQVVRFTRPIKDMDISHNWMICETTAGGSKTNASIGVMPAHMATIVRDPDNPKKKINLKDTEGKKLGLNDFMWALGYGVPESERELPHSPSAKP